VGGVVSTPGGPGRRLFLRRLGASVAASVAAPAAARGATPAPAAPALGVTRSAPAPQTGPDVATPPVRVAQEGWPAAEPGAAVDLSPARWIWVPSERTLANTVVLFRREAEVVGPPASARGWVSADSRYRLWVNGRRVQWGPAPCDPRLLEADPIDLTSALQPGANVIAAEVLFYGHGEGTWPGGKPGFVFALRIEEADGAVQQIVSDERWQVLLDRAHRPGQYKRWYLRALQEDFDARRRPEGWAEPGLVPGEEWLAPLVLGDGADRPAAASTYYEYLGDGGIDARSSALVAREVPLVRETPRPALRLAQSGRIRWIRDPDDWFDYRIPGSFELVPAATAFPSGDGGWLLDPARGEGVWALFELAEQMVGFPFFTIEAPEGTVVELMTQEAHSPDNPPWLDTHFHSWSRFVCREGENRFECLDYESLRFLQIHVRAAQGPVLVHDVGVRRRSYDWPRPPHFRCEEPGLQRLLEASFNTLANAAQETIVDGMGRERQQYSGDVSHMLHATRLVCGDWDLARRFQRTFALGQTHEGYFLDCWPAWDRLNRIAQREVGATRWGPLLDHGVSFIHDVWRHHEETGDEYLAQDLYPQLTRFARYLLEGRDSKGLLPVEGWGVPAVWIDHDAFQQQRHKQCAFNLFTAGILARALVPLAELVGETRDARSFQASADEVEKATVEAFWSSKRGLFVSNLPWLTEEGGGVRLDDRSLATALLFGQCPRGKTESVLEALAEPSAELGLS
jgi:alpha-L-rhamnosidase